MPKQTYEEIAAGPFSIHFCNTNTEMKLKGHCHFAQVFFTFETKGTVGFPSFAHTHSEIQRHLVEQTRKPFRESTNEDVLRQLWKHFHVVKLEEPLQYGCDFRLSAMELHVRGVPDDIGHADAFTIYRISERGNYVYDHKGISF